MKKPPCFNVRALITREVMRKNNVQCNTNKESPVAKRLLLTTKLQHCIPLDIVFLMHVVFGVIVF